MFFQMLIEWITNNEWKNECLIANDRTENELVTGSTKEEWVNKRIETNACNWMSRGGIREWENAEWIRNWVNSNRVNLVTL